MTSIIHLIFSNAPDNLIIQKILVVGLTIIPIRLIRTLRLWLLLFSLSKFLCSNQVPYYLIWMDEWFTDTYIILLIIEFNIITVCNWSTIFLSMLYVHTMPRYYSHRSFLWSADSDLTASSKPYCKTSSACIQTNRLVSCKISLSILLLLSLSLLT